MNFLSITYGVFLLSALGIYWTVGQQWLRLWTLLIASLVFYASLQVQYIPLLFAVMFINYRFGLAIGENTAPGHHAFDTHMSNEEWQFARADWNQRRFKIMWLGVILNVLLLAGFKYMPAIWQVILPQATNSANPTIEVIAPLGISFFVFECIAYLVDVYRGAPATVQFLKFAAYKLFFAKLISGPITRFHTLATQFNELKLPTPEIVADGMWLIARGAFKKGLLADHLGIFVDLCFTNLQRAGSSDLWLAIFAYGLQIYLDFSGYVDIARGSALLFGLVLPPNFDAPYFSTNIADFWRRWHITLGDWLRNYLYFPLGGSRLGLTRTCWNLFIVMLIAGIWHGAALGFVVWGALHGLALVAHRLTETYCKRQPQLKDFWQQPLGIFTAWLLTQTMVFTAWIFFRLPNLQESALVIQRLWGHPADVQFAQNVYVEVFNLNQFQLAFLLCAIAALMSLVCLFNRTLKLQLNWPLKLFFVPICLFTVWVLAPKGGLPYIYFDF